MHHLALQCYVGAASLVLIYAYTSQCIHKPIKLIYTSGSQVNAYVARIEHMTGQEP